MKLPTGGWVPIVIKQGNIFEPVTLSHNVPFHVSWHSVGGCYHNFSLIFFYLGRDKRNPEHLIDSKNQRYSLFYCSYFLRLPHNMNDWNRLEQQHKTSQTIVSSDGLS